MVTLSTSAWIGSLEPWASSTMRMICESTVLPPTAVARNAKAPFWLTVPPTTALPRRLGDRDRLAGDHRFVDIARALDDLAIDGHALARADLDDIA
jgi:hypothetical protein